MKVERTFTFLEHTAARHDRNFSIMLIVERFSNDCRKLKPKPKQLPRPITTGANSAMNQSQFLAITCKSLKAQEKLRVHGAVVFVFSSHWLRNWRESFKPVTKRSNRNHVITFDSHLQLKTALNRTIIGLGLTLEFLPTR